MFKLAHKSAKTLGRTGQLTTAHGIINTPVFMPVGTRGTVKAMTPEELTSQGAQIILANTYHLYLRPGHERIKRLGGLHKFMHWDRPILTDSGGYQIFSLADLRRKFTDDGVEFQSHIDGGERHFLSPELAIEIQEALGSDMMMVLDECTPYPADENAARSSMELSLRWAKRCFDARRSSNALFGIVQGGMHAHLRREYIERLQNCTLVRSYVSTLVQNHSLTPAYQRTDVPTYQRTDVPTYQRTDVPTYEFNGYAIGGLSVGEPTDLMYEIVDVCTRALPEDKPRYLMGVGTPEDLLECIDLGIDMFDCVMPTRHARNGSLFTRNGDINIENAVFADDGSPIDPGCRCYSCLNYSRGYLRHLFMAKEILASRLATIHNLQFYFDLIDGATAALGEDRYPEFKRNFTNDRKG